MKKIYSILLTALVALAFAPAVSGQTRATDYSINGQITDPKYHTTLEFPHDTGVKLPEGKNFGYSKNISKPFSDGTYWIKLESFATGSAQLQDKPSDIVLVLDYSNSMALGYPEDRTNDALFTAEPIRNYSGGGNPSGSTINSNVYYYKHSDGKYYQVSFGGNAQGQGRYLTFTSDDGVVYYLNNASDTSQPGVSTTKPTQPQSNNLTYWRGILYKYNGSRTRLSALKQAVEDFIKVIYHNDNYADDTDTKPRSAPLGNRISVVSFSNSTDTKIIALNSSNMMSGQRSGWFDVSTATGGVNYTTLLNAVKNESNHASTYSNLGMQWANTLLGRIDTAEPTRKANSSRTVVFFTDGVPGGQWVWSDAGCLDTANGCIGQAKTVKGDKGATVFSVALWQGGFVSYEGQQMLKYLNYTSSNYPTASNMTTPGTALPADEQVYQMEAGDDLSAVFSAIAHMSGGNSSNLSAATSTIDVVSSSFMLPEGVDASNIAQYVKIFTAKLNHIDNYGTENVKYVFDTEILAPHSTDTYDVYDANGNVIATHDVDGIEGSTTEPGIQVSLTTTDDGNHGIKVTNFDYSNNWCGPIEDQAGDITYHGHKLMILIPIQMNPDAVGGPNVATNGEGSGIFATSTDPAYIEFKSPTVSLPVNIHIEKAGLVGKESAKFMIEKAVLRDLEGDDDEYTLEEIANIPEANWKYVTTVFVTNSENAQHVNADGTGNPVVRVKGLPADEEVDGVKKGLVYRVHEENWSWAYGNEDGYMYTVTGQMNNPFTFTNSKTTGIDTKIKHSESKVTNVFVPKSTGSDKGKVIYDDLKQNERD